MINKFHIHWPLGRGQSFLYTPFKNPKMYKKIKNRKFRRNLYRYFANQKKMRNDKFRGKDFFTQLHHKIMDREEFKKQYYCTWDLASDHSHDTNGYCR